MKNIKVLIAIFFSISIYSQITRPVGTNLTSVVDWSSELVFTNAFEQCREWIVHEDSPNASWESGLTVPLNEKGYPIEIPYNDGVNPPQVVRTLLFTNIENYYPSGQYRLIIEGAGQIRFLGAFNQTFSTPIDTLINITANQGLILELEKSDVNDPINDIKLIYPNHVNNFQTQKFTTEFLDYLSDFQCIRFMDWTKTNNSSDQNWNERSKANYYTQTTSAGVAWENVIELANLTQKDIWINIPHLATDNYITQLAQLLNTTLDPNIKIYLEYSNEVWNSIFQQNHAAIDFANNLGYTGQNWEKVWKFTSKRSADVFFIFENVFGTSDRFVKILPTQNVAFVAEQIVNNFNNIRYNPNEVTADVIAMAPYFGGEIGTDLGNSGDYATITVSEILDLAETSLSIAINDANSIKNVATANNLGIITYEGGQHLVAYGMNANIQVLTDKLIAANRDSRMGELYCQYFDAWYNTLKGGLFSIFSSHSRPNKYGSWGTKEYMADINSPKYLALQNCVFNYNTLGIESFNDKLDIKIYPNPTKAFINIDGSQNISELDILNTNGQLIRTKTINAMSTHVNISNLSKGIYFVKIHFDFGVITKKIVLD